MRTSASLGAIALSAWLSVCCDACAEDLGRVGPLWSVRERDLLESIQARAAALQKSGAVELRRKEMEARAKLYVDQPPPLGLKRAAASREWTLDPSITLPYDLRDAAGHVIAAAGTRVNPLDQVTLTRELVFLDGRDPEQVAWLRRWIEHKRRRKVVMVGGSLREVGRATGISPLYFDQSGELTRALRVQEVPAVVTQAGKQLRVRVFGMGDSR